MAISRVSSATNNGTTITLGSHAKSDLILYVAVNDGSTLATLPQEVIFLCSRSESGSSIRVGYYHADSSSETVGTTGWTNADNVTAIVYRGASGSIIQPAYVSTGGASNSNIITFAAQNPQTLLNTFPTNTIDLWRVGVAFQIATGNNLGGNPPSGMTNVISSVTATANVAIHDSNSTITTAWTATTVTVTTAARSQTFVLELQELETKISGSGLILSRAMTGGYSA